MKRNKNKSRRGALKQLGATFLGLVGWHVARASTLGAEGGVFASLFLQEGNSVQVPLGYYDPQTQRYVDAKTHKPIFTPDNEVVAAAATSEKSAAKTRLSDKALSDLLGGGGFIDVMALEKLRAFGPQCTMSTLTSLSTCGCCPIITDSTPDRVCDDSP